VVYVLQYRQQAAPIFSRIVRAYRLEVMLRDSCMALGKGLSEAIKERKQDRPWSMELL
jgi:hypothetical protein